MMFLLQLNCASRSHHSIGRIFHGLGHDEVEAGLHQDFLAFVHVGAFEAKHHRKFHISFPGRFDDSGGQSIDAQDTAENIDQNGFHVFVAEQNFEGVRDLLSIRSAAYIEKVCRHASRVFDDVHGGHGEPGAIHHAAHAAIELDVVQAVLRGFDLEWIFFCYVAQFANIRMAEERVVIEGELGIEREEAAVGGGDERD